LGAPAAKGPRSGRLGFEGEVFYPAELLRGVGDEHAAGVGDAAEGVVGGEALAAQEGGEQKRRAADAGAAVGYDAAALEEVFVEGFEKLEEGFGGGGDVAIGNGEAAEADAVTGAGGVFVLEGEVDVFFGSEERDEDVGALALEEADFAFKMLSAVRSRHDCELRGDAGVNPVRHD
jgi:hypothetical protein